MRSFSTYGLDNAVDANDQKNLINSAGLLIENNSKGNSQRYTDRQVMHDNQAWDIRSLMSIDHDTEEMVVVDVEGETVEPGYVLEFTGDLVMYAKDGQRDRIEYDIMRPRWKSASAGKKVDPSDEIKDIADNYLERAEDKL